MDYSASLVRSLNTQPVSPETSLILNQLPDLSKLTSFLMRCSSSSRPIRENFHEMDRLLFRRLNFYEEDLLALFYDHCPRYFVVPCLVIFIPDGP
jgi:hypothetical protein